MKKIAISELNSLFAAIAADRKLYIPTDDSTGQSQFTIWEEGSILSRNVNTVRSAKDSFFPQVENLMGFKVTGKQIELIETRDPAESFAVFGVRACDVRSFDILDRVFLTEPVDTYYAQRRENVCIISLACGKPSETCFCTAFGIDPAEPKGDVTCWMTGEALYWQPNTEKGEALTAQLSVLVDADVADIEQEKAAIRATAEKLPFGKLDLSAFGQGKTKELFNRPEWKALSQSCLGCGTCTFICPTCQCYDIQEFNNGKTVKRFRCWDSCMYSDFTKMSAGQPRPTQTERFRQRFMHKLVYYPDNNEGIFACVGCGRCLRKCPIHMNIVKVIKTMGEGTK
ncbi:MAG: 4Fe-4S dicluster domain-containing protein [Bacteroidaceae bacterium]|nr:4Fe-4S dicluster domain-containing protein [Bacteroidaceae bacterium]